MNNEVVHRLCEDRKGNIWGATNSGVFCYKPQVDSFINYDIKKFGKSSNCLNILCDRQGTVWVTGSSSIFRHNQASRQFEETIKLTGSQDSAGYYYIAKNGLREDPFANGLWIATRESGLMYYDIAKQALFNFKNTPEVSLFKRRAVAALSVSSQGHCWFFDNDQKEIVSFNTATRLELKKINIRGSMPNADGGTLFEDNNQRIWFSSWTYELLIIDQRNNDKPYPLLHHDDNKRSVAGAFFWDVLEDDDKNIWLGTVAGISKCNPERAIYRAWQLPAIIPELKNTAIQLAEENPADGSLWLITNSALLLHYYPSTRQYDIIRFKDAVPGPGGIVPNYCLSIKFFRGNTIITTRSGIWQVKHGDKRLTPFRYLPKGFEDFRCIDMVIDGDSVLYYASVSELLYWNYISGESKLIRFDEETDPATGIKKIVSLTLTPAHQLWMLSSNSHIAWLNPEKKLERIRIVSDKVQEAGVLLAIDQDKAGNVWVLNKGIGIYSYNPADRSVKTWNETDGLAGNRIHKLVTDGDGRVWNILYNKISVYIPGTGKFYNFKIPYSESNLDYYNHITRLANGNIIASINNEIVEFYPERLQGMPSKVKPQISQLSASGRDIPLFDAANIAVRPDENTIRIRFGTFMNREIFPYDIEYKLEGAEKEWTTAGENHEALYNNLNSGHYTFRVRVKGKNSSWQTDEAVIKFTIKTPFYKTTLFLIAVLLLLTGILFFIYRYRLNQKEKMLNLENKAQALEKEKALVMYENLKQQLNPHFLFNSLTSLNSLITAEPKAAGEFLDSLSKTYRYILKSRDNETVPLVDEIRFAENYIKLQKTRFEKGFDVVINIPEEYYHRKIVPVTLQNLVENAIKHNIIDEESPLVVNIYVEEDLLVVKNNLQRKNFVETSNRQGLASMQSLYQYLSHQPVTIIETSDTFTIKLPLL
jgi:ligand-binding sensor domain-containing protein